MAQVPASTQGFVPERVQEFNRRASQDVTDSPVKKNDTPKKEPLSDRPGIEKLQPKLKEDKPKDAFNRTESKNPFSPHFYNRSSSSRHGHFEMGPRGLDYSPHRMESHRREFGPQRSTSIHGHELTDGPTAVKPEYLGQRQFGSQVAPGGMNHPDVVFRHDYYSQMGFSPPRASRFSSQEYLNTPAQYGRWHDYRAEYRQRRRSQQDLHSMEGNEGMPYTLSRSWYLSPCLITLRSLAGCTQHHRIPLCISHLLAESYNHDSFRSKKLI